MTRDQRPELDWQGGAPVALRFDDPYFSLSDGLAETRHVFLDGNGLPGRFRPGFHVAELGFGTGLNCLAALRLWNVVGVAGPLRFTSFEAYPMAASDMARALAEFPEISDLIEPLVEAVRAGHRSLKSDRLDLRIVEGDARETLHLWDGRADAWFLDGFSPAKSPEMWETKLLAEVARHTAPGGTAATYSAAGSVRRGLEAAGFEVSRAPGFGRKRHMSRAVLK